MKIRSLAGIAAIGLACLTLVPTVSSRNLRPAETRPDAVVASLDAVANESTTVTTRKFVGGAYRVEIYGGTAVGHLRHRFVNESDDDARFVFTILAPEPFAITGLGIEKNGRLNELAVADRTETPAPAAQAGGGTAGRPSARSGRETKGRSTAQSAPMQITIESEPLEIPAGEAAEVVTSFRLPLTSTRGNFKLVLPAIAVPALTEPIATGPMRIGVTVHHDAPLPEASSPSHEILVDFEGDRTVIEPVEREVRGSRPFELEFRVNPAEKPTLAGYLRDSGDGFQELEAVLSPPEAPVEGAARPKQMLLVVDTSGSMRRENKLEQARSALLSFVESLEPEDRFNIIEFDNDFHLLYSEPQALGMFGEEPVAEWLRQLAADGSTMMKPALAAALRQPVDEERHRMIVVVTDGILQDELPVLDLLREELGDGRLFVVGTGSRARHETLIRLAEFGRGAATFANRPDQLETAVSELLESIADPLGWDLEFDWEGAGIEESFPQRLPDLYADRPVRVLVKVQGELPDRMRVRMSTTEGQKVYTVRLPPSRLR